MDAVTRFGVAFIGIFLLVVVVITGRLVAEFVGLWVRSIPVKCCRGDKRDHAPVREKKAGKELL